VSAVLPDAEARIRIAALLDDGKAGEAKAELALLWGRRPTLSNAGFVLSALDRMKTRFPLAPHRVAFLRSFTLEPMIPFLRAAAALHGIGIEPWIGEFNAYPQEILDAGGALYAFAPDSIVLAVETRALAPGLWSAGFDPGAAEALVERAVADLSNLIAALRSNSKANIVVHALDVPARAANGILDAQREVAAESAIGEINRRVRERCRTPHANVYWLDYPALVARHGRLNWYDERKWLSARLPITAAHLADMAAEWLRFVIPLAHRTAKVLVVDLDNTLWGGVLGEDGIGGIRLGDEYPGAAYTALQKVILDLHRRGVVLAICSKNDAEEALATLRDHPAMVLRPEHFAAFRINWQPKPDNLRSIAAELKLGLDSFVFLDDNPAERSAVARMLPEVAVIDLPDDAMAYAGTLQAAPHFEVLGLSDEDRARGVYYAGDRMRAELEAAATTPEDFLKSLEIVADVAPVDDFTLGRAAQLTQKTNQFNLTTRRYTEGQLAELAASDDWQVLTLRSRDRFGDNGLVGLAILNHRGDACEIDTFLLSCRVIGRGLETALLAEAIAASASRGAKTLRGWFLLTRKNAPAADFYARHGFRQARSVDGGTLWEAELGAALPTSPAWIAQGNRAAA
jgi:FkbH-like protein